MHNLKDLRKNINIYKKKLLDRNFDLNVELLNNLDDDNRKLISQKENLEQKKSKIEGYTTKVFLHEWDHLQGVTFKDRVSKMKWDMAKKKAIKLRKKYA